MEGSVRYAAAIGLALVSLGSCKREGGSPSPPERVSVAEASGEREAASTGASDDPATAAIPSEAEVEPPWREQDWPRIAAVQPLVRASAAQYGIDPHLINAIIWHESKFHPEVTGPGGSAGLMQLMPGTSKALAKRLGRPHRPYDPEFNVEVGTYLLARLLEKFDGDERLALAGYGLGSGRVRSLLAAGEPLPERTERFIAKVQRWRRAFAQADAERSQPRDAARRTDG